MVKFWTLSALLAERFVSQSRDCWDVACQLDTHPTGGEQADTYSRAATRYAICAGYLAGRVKRDRASQIA